MKALILSEKYEWKKVFSVKEKYLTRSGFSGRINKVIVK